MLARRQTPFVVAFSGCQSGEHILAEALKRWPLIEYAPEIVEAESNEERKPLQKYIAIGSSEDMTLSVNLISIPSRNL